MKRTVKWLLLSANKMSVYVHSSAKLQS